MASKVLILNAVQEAKMHGLQSRLVGKAAILPRSVVTHSNQSVEWHVGPLDQVNNIKYLRIIIDSKLNFRDHLIYTSTKCTKIIHALAKSAKLSWGLKHEALNSIYKGTILPLMLYGAPVWIEAMEKKCNKNHIYQGATANEH